jgi:hypothetical protein
MKPIAFASIVIRGLSLWLLVGGIYGVSAVFEHWHQGERLRYPAILVLALRVLLPVATAMLVWTFADWLAKRVASLEDDATAGPGWTAREMLRVATAIVGLVTVAQAIPDLAWYASVYVGLNWWQNTLLGPETAPAEVVRRYWTLTNKAHFATSVVRMGIGVLFAVKPQMIASLVGGGEGLQNADGSRGAAQQGDEADEAR